MEKSENVILARDCEATEIPSGRVITLYKGTELMITQALGGTYTVVTRQGAMSSISGRDADAIGREIFVDRDAEGLDPSDDAAVEKKIWNQMRTCYDPEIPHNIVDLGLIYSCEVIKINDQERQVAIQMTLTAPGCGMGDWIRQDVINKVMTVPTVKECRVDVTFDPPWNPGKINPALRREMNL